MRNIFTHLIFLFVLLLPQVLHGEIIHSSHLQISEGLQQSTIYSIYQDEFGMIWFGTKNGLVRFDGNRTEYIDKIFQDIPLSESLIRHVCGNRKGMIYLSTRSEVIEYNIRTNTFSEVINEPGIIHYGTGRLWICQKNTISYWEDGTFKPYITLPKEDIFIECMVETPGKDLYLGTKEHGIFRVTDQGKIDNYFSQFNQVKQLLFDPEENLWIATRRGGLYKMDRNGELTGYKNNPNNPNSLSSNIVRAICEDDQNNLWVATFGGLNKYVRKEDKFVPCDFLSEQFYSLNDNSIYCLYKDQQGTIWTGSYMGEINYFDPDYETFRYHFTLNREWSNPNRNIILGKMAEESQQNIWVSAERNGLFYYNVKQNKLAPYPLPEEQVNIQTIYPDKDKNILWIGTLLEGLKRLDINKPSLHTFRFKNNSIREILPYKDYLLLATLNGIFQFDPSDGSYTSLESSTHSLDDHPITSMTLDSNEMLWIAYDNRLLKYNLRTHECELIKLHGRDFNNVNKIYEDRSGDIWIGTKRHGLYLIRKGSSEPLHFHKTNGLGSNLVVDLSEDKDGNMLIVTGNGLSYFVSDSQQIIHIQREKFIPGFALSENCLFINNENKVFISGVNALCEFSVENLLTSSRNYTINFSRLAIDGERIEVNSEKSVLKESLLYCEKLVLPPHSNALSLEVFTNNYISVVKNGIQYKLEGFDKEWREANSLNEITYTSLSPGHYTLLVRGDIPIPNGQYPERKLEIEVKYPFYKSPAAYIFYLLLLILVLYAIYQFTTLRSSLRLEKEQKRYMEEANQSKLRFFMNVSHEFKTPLTLIYNHVETLLNSKILSPKIHGHLLSIWKNTTRMNRLISELMDFRKQEQGFLKLKVSEHNMVALIKEVVLSFKEYARSRGISLTVESKSEDISFCFDTHQIEKVIFNLLSNAFKFTSDNGHVVIRIEKEEKKVSVHISDTGIGISANEQKKIFDRFYQTEDASYTHSSGTGIGLAFSKNIVEAHQGEISVQSIKGQGSTFSITLPTDISYLPENIEKTPLLREKAFEAGEIPDEHFFNEIKEQQEKFNTRNSTILIIEDEEEIREFLIQVFNTLYRVVSAKNGKEGYELALSERPDIILSDIVMPEMSGIELCKKLKTNLEISHIPIVLLTSQSASEYIIEGLKTGADDYITKPFSTRHLIVRCHNLVNNRKALQKKFTHEIGSDSTELIATTSIDQEIIENSIRVIHENLDNPLFSIDFIAQTLKIGRTKYFSKIKAITGMTPNEFVTNTKLKYAVRLLNENSSISINELSENLGFNSTSHFIRLFKEFTGVTPNEYKSRKG